jgi:hypothetical protein
MVATVTREGTQEIEKMEINKVLFFPVFVEIVSSIFFKGENQKEKRVACSGISKTAEQVLEVCHSTCYTNWKYPP